MQATWQTWASLTTLSMHLVWRSNFSSHYWWWALQKVLERKSSAALSNCSSTQHSAILSIRIRTVQSLLKTSWQTWLKCSEKTSPVLSWSRTTRVTYRNMKCSDSNSAAWVDLECKTSPTQLNISTSEAGHRVPCLGLSLDSLRRLEDKLHSLHPSTWQLFQQAEPRTSQRAGAHPVSNNRRLSRSEAIPQIFDSNVNTSHLT